MPLIQQTIKNLIAGISQQPPKLRHAEQLEEQINGFSTGAGGLQKRPPTQHIKRLPALPLKTKVHLINRDENERYIVAFTGDNLKVFDINGNERTVKLENNAEAYVTSSEPNKQLKAITVADHTFIVNTTKVVEMNNNEKSSDDWKKQGSLIVVRQGQYGRKYTVNIQDQEYTYETPDGGAASHSKMIATDYIANQLYEKLAGNFKKTFSSLTDEEMRTYGITKSKKGRWGGSDNDHWIETTTYHYKDKAYSKEDMFSPAGVQGSVVIKGTNWIQIIGNLKDISVSDGFNGEALKLFINTTTRFEILPSTAPDGFTVLVKGEKESDDDYYVKYDSGSHSWKECAKPNITIKYVFTTMPYILRREADGTFTCTTADWNERKTGDEDSNPTPSFVGNKINDIFFFRNRLGIISGEAVNLSRTSDFFNFWVNSATGVVDTDPIDLQVSHNRVSTLYNAVPFNQDLYLFSAQTQFVLRAEGVLSPKTAVIDQVTEFDADTWVKPIGVGRNLYFTAHKTDFTTVQEYFAVADSTTQKNATDVTGHVPNFLKNSIYSLKACNNENLLIALSDNQRDTMYIYKFLFLNDSKAQASWSSWTFDGELIGADFINSVMYLVINRGGNTFLEKLPISYNTKDFVSEPYRVMLDRKFKTTLHGTFDKDTKEMRYDVKSIYGDAYSEPREYTIVLKNGSVYSGKDTVVIPHQVEPLEDFECFIGVAYEFKFIYSTFFIKQASQTGTDTIPNDRLQLRFLHINYDNTGEFEVIVNATGKTPKHYKMTARIVGTPSNQVGIHPLETGEFRVPLMGRNTDTSVTVINTSPLPSAFNTTVWQGLVTYKFRQI
nr:MAG TPA_asm: stabilization protein [Bacteriophage sp.]